LSAVAASPQGAYFWQLRAQILMYSMYTAVLFY